MIQNIRKINHQRFRNGKDNTKRRIVLRGHQEDKRNDRETIGQIVLPVVCEEIILVKIEWSWE